jgi:hypothetical protein
LLTGCSHDNLFKESLVNITKEIDTSLIKTNSHVSINSIKHGKVRAINMIYQSQNPVPKVTFLKGNNEWKLSRYRYIAADITNPGTEDLFVEFRMNENDHSSYTQFYGWNAGGQVIPAGETRTVKTYVMRTNEYPSYLDEQFFGMDALPGGIVKSFWWAILPPDSVTYFSIALMYPPDNSRIIISDIRGEDEIDPPSKAELADNYFPFVDEFGQFKHKDWPGKIHSLDELETPVATAAGGMWIGIRHDLPSGHRGGDGIAVRSLVRLVADFGEGDATDGQAAVGGFVGSAPRFGVGFDDDVQLVDHRALVAVSLSALHRLLHAPARLWIP